MADSVYQSDPDAAPDSEFLPGELRHLVPGNRARLMDPRRTPVHVTGVLPGTGFFEVEIDAFEDAGQRWLVPLESVASYQFAHGGATAAGAELEMLRAAAASCDVQVTVTAGPLARAGSGPARRRVFPRYGLAQRPRRARRLRPAAVHREPLRLARCAGVAGRLPGQP